MMKLRKRLILWAAIGLLCGVAEAAEEIRIDSDFPGGNVLVDSVRGDVVRLRPDLRDTDGWWFYWYFRVQGAGGRELRFEFTDGAPVGVRGPVISQDGGRTWRWLGAASGDTRSFAYRFAADAGDCRFAFTVPYLQADWERFLAPHREDPRARPEVLCQSRGGRAVECLYLGVPEREPQHRILLTARHHACEAMANYALEGLLQTVLAPDSDDARWLAEQAEFLVIPFVDKDGVDLIGPLTIWLSGSLGIRAAIFAKACPAGAGRPDSASSWPPASNCLMPTRGGPK